MSLGGSTEYDIFCTDTLIIPPLLHDQSEKGPENDLTTNYDANDAQVQFSDFKVSVLTEIQNALGYWKEIDLENDFFKADSMIHFNRCTGAMSNVVYIVESIHPEKKPDDPAKILVRIYGNGMLPNIDQMSDYDPSSRKKAYIHLYFNHFLESTWMRALALRGLSPSVYGHFLNGRLEQCIESNAMNAVLIKNPRIYKEVAINMASLHESSSLLKSVSKSFFENYTQSGLPLARQACLSCFDFWRVINESLQKVKAILSRWYSYKTSQNYTERRAYEKYVRLVEQGFGTTEFEVEWDLVSQIVHKSHAQAKQVFCHLDLQPGNLLISAYSTVEENSTPDITLIDYEYANWGPRAADIANFFCEWMADYATEQPFVLYYDRYPSREHQWAFIREYIQTIEKIRRGQSIDPIEIESRYDDAKIESILLETDFFSLCSDLKWMLWGIEQYESRRNEKADRKKFFEKHQRKTRKPRSYGSSDSLQSLMTDVSSSNGPVFLYFEYALNRWQHFIQIKDRIIHRLLVEDIFPLSNL